MFQYIMRRLVLTIPVLFGVSVLVFLMMHLIPGDPALALLRGQPEVTDADVQRVRDQFGLNEPLPVQYFDWLKGAVQGDFGTSVQTRRSVMFDIKTQAPSTIKLAFAAMIFAITLGTILGTISALHKNTWVDSFAMMTALFGVSMPSFWFGLILIYFFAFRLGWLPAVGDTGFKALILPAIALGLDFSAATARLVRANLIEVLISDYVKTARAKGLSERVVVVRHAMRNAIIPTITIIGIQLGSLLAGAVVVETVFARQGIGRLLLSSIIGKDFPTVQAIVLLAALTYIIINLLVDISYAILDPRIRYS